MFKLKLLNIAEDLDPLSLFAMEAKKETNQNNNQPALEFDLLNSLQPQTEDEENNGLDEVFPEENKKIIMKTFY